MRSTYMCAAASYKLKKDQNCCDAQHQSSFTEPNCYVSLASAQHHGMILTPSQLLRSSCAVHNNSTLYQIHCYSLYNSDSIYTTVSCTVTRRLTLLTMCVMQPAGPMNLLLASAVML
jgi:hypothetical protein